MMVPLLDAADDLTDRGYCVVRDVVSRADVERIVAAVDDVLRSTPAGGHPSFADVYRDVQAIEAIHELARSDSMMSTARGLLRSDSIYSVPSRGLRIVPQTQSDEPGSPFSTRPHRDSSAGFHPATLILWVPLRANGTHPLTVIPGSHRTCSVSSDTALRYLPVPADDTRWVAPVFEIGDLVALWCSTIHAARAHHGDPCRLSLDARYADCSVPLAGRYARFHRLDDDVASVARGFRRPELMAVPDEVDIDAGTPPCACRVHTTRELSKPDPGA